MRLVHPEAWHLARDGGRRVYIRSRRGRRPGSMGRAVPPVLDRHAAWYILLVEAGGAE